MQMTLWISRWIGINSGRVRGSVLFQDSQFADVCEVDKGGFLGSDSDHLRRLHHKLPLLPSHHVGVFLSHDVEDSVQELRQRWHTEFHQMQLTHIHVRTERSWSLMSIGSKIYIIGQISKQKHNSRLGAYCRERRNPVDSILGVCYAKINTDSETV